MNLILYAVLALAVMGMIGTGVYKVKQWGAEEVRTEWAAANKKAAEDAETERKRQDSIRAAQDKEATRRLADARKSNAALLTSLDAHIRAAKLPAGCKLDDRLLGDVNAALAGAEGVSPGTVPSKPGTTPPAR